MTHPPRWTPRMADQSGIALPLALLGLVAVSLLVTAALVSSSTEVAISSAQQDATRDFYRAEGAIERYVAERATTLSPTAAEGVSYQPEAGTAPVRITVSELSRLTINTNPTIYKRTYAVQAQPLTSGSQPQGRRVVAMVQDSFKVDSLQANVEGGATTTSKEVTIGGSSFISGKTDERLCADGDTVKAVILARDSQNVDIKAANIDGGLDEVEKKDMSRTELASYVLGGLTPYEMAQYATIKFKSENGLPAWPSKGAPTSDSLRTSRMNWGCPLKLYQVFDPGNACTADGDENYFPVVSVYGDVSLSGQHGQGMLIVLGDLDVQGKFFYSGIIVVTGETFIRGSGGESRIDGALVALGDVSLCTEDSGSNSCTVSSDTTDADESTSTLGNAKIMYNSCMVAQAQDAYNEAMMNAAQTGTVLNRTFGWFEVVR